MSVMDKLINAMKFNEDPYDGDNENEEQDYYEESDNADADYGKEDTYQWMIVPKEMNVPIGSISVVEQNADIGKAEIGYCIGKAWWHQGMMTEALQAVMDFLFDEVGMNRLEARHDPRNPHSGAVMRKCGMKYEGTTRQADRNNQGICDASIYGLLKDER